MTAGDLLVRPYTATDHAALVQLLRQVWSHKPDVEAVAASRWWWDVDPPPLVVVDDRPNDRLAGVAAYIPFTLRAGGADLEAAWLVDFYVLGAYQGKGLGQRLTLAVEEQFSVTASLSQTEMAYRVFRKLGWSERTPAVLSMNPAPMRTMFPRSKELRVMSSPIESAARVPDDVDPLWERVRDAYPAIAERSGAAILRRYAARGNRSYLLHRAYRSEGCVGYLVTRLVRTPSRVTALIVDFLVHPDDRRAFAALLSAGAAAAIDAGARRVYCLSTPPGLQRVLRSRGFLSPSMPLLGRFLRGQNKWLTYRARTNPDPGDPAGWFLTLGDCDLDVVW